MKIFGTFGIARERLIEEFRDRSYEVKPDRWQGMSVGHKPEAAMREILNWSFQVSLRGIELLEHWQRDIQPNLPFADVHFKERISGEPTNPGEAYKIWPWGHKAEEHRTEDGQFTHTYQERFWPKYAGDQDPHNDPKRGIRYAYGDYNDLVQHLADDPLSRQGYLPIWFPEDGTCRGRKPCTLGYHFIRRHGFLHTTYYIRSCDFYRHYNDDIYLTTRLALDLLARLRRVNEMSWRDVKPGMLTFHCVSMHLFLNDFRKIINASKEAASPLESKVKVNGTA